jgi:hypothetical protein
MSSLSEFIGFIVIFIFPRPERPKSRDRSRQTLLRTKSSESLVHRSDEDDVSDEDVVSIPSTSRSLAVNNNDTLPRVKIPEPVRASALSRPEFWMIAFIMSMCKSSLLATSKRRFSEWLRFDVYKRIVHRCRYLTVRTSATVLTPFLTLSETTKITLSS